ncbi:tellurite resistance/C4-dicarboxylate transporter family protein [Acidithiobacillus sp. IBUN Pt1247-S3]
MAPSYFSLVMATGIDSITSYLLGFSTAADIFLAINIIFYLVLVFFYVWRAIYFTSETKSDILNQKKNFGYFSFIAGTVVLGTQLELVWNDVIIGVVLWIVAVVSLIVIGYGISFITIKRVQKPASLFSRITGAWLLATVATQSVSILCIVISHKFFMHETSILIFLSLLTWLLGGAFYIWIISIIGYRLVFISISPLDLSPTYWVNMGAAAISAVAGSTLVQDGNHTSIIVVLIPFIKAIILLDWTVATWWIPLLGLLGVWKHLVHKIPIRYEVGYWAMVFPIGMYSLSCVKIAEVFHIFFLGLAAYNFYSISLLCWVFTAYGMCKTVCVRLLADLRPRNHS